MAERYTFPASQWLAQMRNAEREAYAHDANAKLVRQGWHWDPDLQHRTHPNKPEVVILY